MGRPLVVALNMMDVARNKGLRIDVAGLAARLGCTVVTVSAASGEGIEDFKGELLRAMERLPVSPMEIRVVVYLMFMFTINIGGGIQVMATFIPIIAFLYIFLSILEDSGYMARAAIFQVGGQNIVFGLYLIGIAAVVLTGLVMKTTLLKGESTPFVMELPLHHLPPSRGWPSAPGSAPRASSSVPGGSL